MIIDKKGLMLARVRNQCENCETCIRDRLEAVIQVLGMTSSIINVVGVFEIKKPRYAVYVGNAQLEFIWLAPNAGDLDLVCPEVTK